MGTRCIVKRATGWSGERVIKTSRGLILEAFAAGNNLEIFWHDFEENCKHDQRLERKVAGQGAWGNV